MAGETLETIRHARFEKVQRLLELGINPYPSKLEKEPQRIINSKSAVGDEIAIAGRIMGYRLHGEIIFADLQDETGSIQLFFQKKKLKGQFKIAELLDVGDFLLGWGKVFKTESGETSVDVENFQILTKSINPLPSMWYGLKDVEDRYRKRYLDILLNNEVRERLVHRTKIVSAIRKFLDDKGFLEVETPTLQPIYGGGFAKPFITHHNALDTNFYLRISDEMYLKRLIVGGLERVYEIYKVFRNEGVDQGHNPEFTMLEAQIAYTDYKYGMDIVEELFECVAKKVFEKTNFEFQNTKLNLQRPWKRLKLVEAIKEYSGIDPLNWKSLADAKKQVISMEINEERLKELEKIGTIGEVMAFAFEQIVEPKLIHPTIIYDFPVEVSPLAKKCEDERFTQRFEFFVGGMELGNNYSELNDPVDLRKRFSEEKKREKIGVDEAHQTDEDYLLAIEYGFPPTCGLGVGIDRMVMIMTNGKNIKEVIAFPTLRPEK